MRSQSPIVLSERQRVRSVWWGLVLDVVVFAGITAFAFNGYEAGKTFFVVPVLAALTVPGIPVLRRLEWIAIAAAIAWLVFDQRPMNTEGALESIPRDAGAFARGILAFAKSYVVDWEIDFPALALAAVVAIFALRRHRLFWTALFVTALGLTSLNAFQYDGAFLTPHRFLLLAFVSVLIVSVALSDAPTRLVGVPVCTLIVVGMAYTSYQTVRFVRSERPMERRNFNVGKVFPLPYHRSKLDQHIWPYRIADAITFLDVARQGSESHVFFYGFSAIAEDTVNPQFFFSRLLLPMGYSAFTRRVTFVDHFSNMYFQFPIKPLSAVVGVARELRPPFFVHVHEPDHSADAVIATYFNRARVSPVDLGLRDFRSYRVDAFAPPGPVPVGPLHRPPRIPFAGEPGADGYCLTTVDSVDNAYIDIRHPDQSLSERLDAIRAQVDAKPTARRFAPVAEATVKPAAIAEFVAYVNNPRDTPFPITLRVVAEDEVALTVNDQPIIDVPGWHPTTQHVAEVLLPSGTSELRLLNHGFRQPGAITFTSTDGRTRFRGGAAPTFTDPDPRSRRSGCQARRRRRALIRKILTHLGLPTDVLAPRPPPACDLFGWS
jgi:hypothetical protein